jgi:uncharacterized membrane protein
MRLINAILEHYDNIGDHVTTIVMSLIEELAAKTEYKAQVKIEKVKPEMNIYIGMILQTLSVCMFKYP